MSCSMTTSKLWSLAHISRIVKGCQGSFQLAGHVNDFLHTKHLVVKALRFPAIMSHPGFLMFGAHLPQRHRAVHLAPCRKHGDRFRCPPCLYLVCSLQPTYQDTGPYCCISLEERT